MCKYIYVCLQVDIDKDIDTYIIFWHSSIPMDVEVRSRSLKEDGN